MMTLMLLFARGAVVLGFALLAVRLARRAAASVRYALLASALVAAIALPVIAAVVPVWHARSAPAPVVEVAQTFELPIAEPASPVGTVTPSIAVAPTASSMDPRVVFAILWSLGLAVALLRIAGGALRARELAWRGLPVRGVDVRAAWRALGGRGEPPAVVATERIETPV